MIIFKKAIPRRTFLRGVGTTVALPLLDAMVPSLAASNEAFKPPKRMAFIYGPNGRIMDQWTPATEGSSFQLPPTLHPLTPFQDQLLVISGLDLNAADARENEGGGVHARPCAGYLTGIHSRPGEGVGVSVDQLAARKFGKETQLGSLELSLESGDIVGNTDGDYSNYYLRTISWRGPKTPLPTEHNPRKVFERLIGDQTSTDPAERSRIVQKRKSVLDSLTDGVNRLLAELGAADRGKLTQYLDALRDVERRIQIAEQQTDLELPDMKRPAGIPASFSEHAKLMFDLMGLAFQGDLTRVITFMWTQEQGTGNYREIDVPEGHHASSHHGSRPEIVNNCKKIDLLHSNLFAYFLDKMRSTPEADGSLLDHSLIHYGSALSDGMGHIHHDLPTLLVGGGFKGGRHLRFQDVPLSNLLLTLMDTAGIPADNFIDEEWSDATGKLDLSTM